MKTHNYIANFGWHFFTAEIKKNKKKIDMAAKM